MRGSVSRGREGAGVQETVLHCLLIYMQTSPMLSSLFYLSNFTNKCRVFQKLVEDYPLQCAYICKINGKNSQKLCRNHSIKLFARVFTIIPPPS